MTLHRWVLIIENHSLELEAPFGALVVARDTSQKKKSVKVRQPAGECPFGVTFFKILRVWQYASALLKIKTGLDLFLFLLSHSHAWCNVLLWHCNMIIYTLSRSCDHGISRYQQIHAHICSTGTRTHTEQQLWLLSQHGYNILPYEYLIVQQSVCRSNPDQREWMCAGELYRSLRHIGGRIPLQQG